MPYIPQDQRSEVHEYGATDVGELTYALTTLCLNFMHLGGAGPRFVVMAEVLGALEATKLELYRRSVAPYEDRKVAENGDLPYPWRESVQFAVRRDVPSANVPGTITRNEFRVDL